MKSFFRFLGGVKLAIFLIAAAATAVAVGTFLESRTGSHIAAENAVYRNPLFLLLLGGFFINILTATLLRMPFRLAHTPFIITHIGLLMIIAGTAIKLLYGVQGRLIVLEGGVNNRITLSNTMAVSLFFNEGDPFFPRQVDLLLEKGVLKTSSTLPFSCELVSLIPHSDERFEYWIKAKHLFIQGLDPIPLGQDTFVRFEDTIWTLRAEHCASFDELSFTPQSFPFLFFVQDDEGHVRVTAFESEKASKEQLFLPDNFGTIAVYEGGFGGYTAVTKDILPFELETPLTKKVKALAPLAKEEENHPLIKLRFRDGTQTEEVFLRFDATGGLKWPVLGGKALVAFGPATLELPFALRLHDAKKVSYPGSSQPYAFESLISIIAPSSVQEHTISMNRVYESPEGFRFYMAQLSPDQETSTKRAHIVVNRDPARKTLTYPGALILTIGIINLFFMKKLEIKQF